MHELSVCLALVEQVQQLAADHGAHRVDRITLQIGPLSGVEPALIRHAFPLVVVDSIAAQAELIIESIPIRVHCRECGSETEATTNRLLCGVCGGYQTRLLSGNEMLLANLELSLPDDGSGQHEQQNDDQRSTDDV